jgi:2-phospho-L-lactate guanylyltransferase
MCEEFLRRTLNNLAALRPTPEIVVLTSDPEARRVALTAGVAAFDDRGLGLNGALRLARAMLGSGHRRVLISPTDLPCADTAALRRFLTADAEVAIAPDRAGTGTNLLALGRAAFRDFPFAYGPDSFDRHICAAAEGGWRTRVVRDAALSLDIDTPDDLALWRGDGKPADRAA